MDQYQIITDEAELQRFIEWLPEPQGNDRFYVSLLSRTKYRSDATRNAGTLITRFITSRDRLFDKIRQLEIPLDGWKEFGEPVAQESLALYINPNPRSMRAAGYEMIRELSRKLEIENSKFNLPSLSMDCLQKAGDAIYLDFDIDDKDVDLSQLYQIFNSGEFQIIATRGGYHILVKMGKHLKQNWRK